MHESRLIDYIALQLPFNVDNDSSNKKTMKFVALISDLLLVLGAKLSDFHYDLQYMATT